MKHRRLSPVILKHGSRRPEVIMLQEALNALEFDCGAADGWWGKKTTKAVTAFQTQEFGVALTDQLVGRGTWTRLLERTEHETGWRPSLERRIQTVICYYENSTRTNAYGSTSRLNDGAGYNYGVLQHNGYGSLATLLEMAGQGDLLRAYKAGGRDRYNADVQHWMGSVEGIAAQNKYFHTKTVRQAREIADEVPGITDYFAQAHLLPYHERYLLLLADSANQNGALWSPNRKPFWRSITNEEAKHAKYRELYHGYRFNQLFMGRGFSYDSLKAIWTEVERAVKAEGGGRREINKRAMIRILRDEIPDPEMKLVLIAQWRARSSSPKWWTDVEVRRMLDATGEGSVHGSRQLSLAADFGFADEETVTWPWTSEDNPPESE